MDLVARKWENMSHEDQIEYLKRHKHSKLRPVTQSNELENIKKTLKTYGLNRSVEGKQSKAEEQINFWADKLRELGFDEKQTDNGYKFIGNDFEVDLNVTKGKMRYFANFEIKPKQFEIAASDKSNIRKQLKILYTNGKIDEFVNLLNKNWFNPFKGGLADDKSPINFDKNQLVKGIKVEFEHVSDIFKAAKIAMDHLTESKSYYIDLERMERDSKIARKNDEDLLNEILNEINLS